MEGNRLGRRCEAAMQAPKVVVSSTLEHTWPVTVVVPQCDKNNQSSYASLSQSLTVGWMPDARGKVRLGVAALCKKLFLEEGCAWCIFTFHHNAFVYVSSMCIHIFSSSEEAKKQ